MQDTEFRNWLSARRWNGKPLTSVSSRMSKARRFEKAMPALGLGAADLDAAFDADGMERVTQCLRDWCRAAVETGQAPAELVGTTTNAPMRINNVAAAVRNYRQFREGAASVEDWPALEEMRAAFLDRIPEFERFTATDNGYERVERSYKDAMIAAVGAIAASADDDDTAGRRIYRALIPSAGPLLRWQTDDDLTRKHPDLAPAFYTTIGRLARDRSPVADAIMTAADALAAVRAAGATTLTVGQVAGIAITVAGVARAGGGPPGKGSTARALATLLTGDPIFRGGTLTRDQLDRWFDLLRAIETVMRDRWQWEPRDLVDVQGFAWAAMDDAWGDGTGGEGTGGDDMDDDDVFAHFDGNAAFAEARAGWSDAATAAFRTVAQAAHDAGLDWWFVNKPPYELRCGRKDAGRLKARAVLGYIGEPGPWLGLNEIEGPRYVAALGLIDDRWAALTPDLAARFAALVAGDGDRDEDFGAYWRFGAPARDGLWPDEGKAEIPAPTTTGPIPAMRNDPTNLILYGPPGTGKTFATAEHAVRLCGEAVPADRAALMTLYRTLSEAGRIEFVTFHQSMAYEDFVEGLRPEPNAEGAGFTLEPKPGIFRRIARRAETSTGPGDTTFTIGDRQVFKMSIGEVANPDDAALFEDAIAGGYAVLGFVDIDWSDARYADRRAIIDAIHAHDGNTEADATSGRVQMPHIFRNWMKPGDLVIVSKGNGLFRAIGEITGDYRFVPREGGGYAHRRAVRWLWIDRAGVPVSEIYARGFSMRSAYQLTPADLNIPALERYVASQQNTGTGAAESFVLVIDEINRANISKVFGELITLLEPDKRLGKPDALRVRLPHSQDAFGVPANLHIIGTMNTADRSIALIDKALRRRFTFREMMPDYDVAGLDLVIDGVTLGDVLAAINDRIEYLLDREHQIGHGWVMHCTTRDRLDATMRTKVIPLIAEYFFEDWGRTADVLGGREGNPFLDRVALTPPPGIVAEEPRYRWSIASDFAPGAYARLVAGR